MGESFFIYESDKLVEKFEKIKNAIDIAKETALGDIDRLQKQLNIEKIKPITKLYLETISIDIYTESSVYSYSNTPKIRIIIPDECIKKLKGVLKSNLFSIFSSGVDSAIELIEKIYELDKETHEINILNSKSNEESKKSIISLIKSLGVASSYSGYKTNRSRNRETIYYNWESEITNQFACYYNSTLLDSKKAEIIKKIKDYYAKKEKEVADEKAKKEKEKEVMRANKKLALLLAKYDLSLDDSWEDVIHKILEQDKYLKLAYYLEKNRGDWNDGCDYAETGLCGFSVVLPVDQDIYDEINGLINEWGDIRDGRCFRDCKYNYGTLYAMGNANLLLDLKECMENED